MKIASRNHRFIVGLFCASIGLTASFASCTDSYDKNLTASTGHPSTSSGISAGGAGGGLFGDGPMCHEICSNDLKAVINDCTNAVTQTCAPDKGCANGMCMDNPCKAADVAKSSYGCDYWALKTAQRPQADGACFAAVIANTWPKSVHLTVSRAGMTLKPEMFTYIPDVQGGMINYNPYDPVAGLAEGQVAILFLSRGSGGLINCPMPAALSADTGVVGTDRGTAFHITSDYPVVAYQIDPFGGGMTSYASATLLIPTSAWDKDYRAISAYKTSLPNIKGDPSLNVLAYKDNTDVTITPPVDIIAAPNVPGTTAGMPVKYTLNTGEYIQITQPQELTGASISATQPVGVFGAHTCMTVPDQQLDCDSAQQQIAPFHALANEYVAVRYKNRVMGNDEAPPWRVVGGSDGVTLTWSPTKPPGAPNSLMAGEVAEFTAAGPFIVRSQDLDHPFYLGQYMTGGAPFTDIGDPEWVNVTPPAQFLSQYVFFTDPTYPETSLVVIRTPGKLDGKFADVNIKCGGMNTVLAGWMPIGNYEYARLDLVTGNFAGVNGCTNGRQEMTSTLPFGVTVWGWGTTQQTKQVSYAYPAGAAFQSINTVPLPPPH